MRCRGAAAAHAHLRRDTHPKPPHLPCCAPLQALGWALYSSALVACLYLLFQAVAGVAYW